MTPREMARERLDRADEAGQWEAMRASVVARLAVMSWRDAPPHDNSPVSGDDLALAKAGVTA